MIALKTISFILSIFPLLMGCISLPILFLQEFFVNKKLDREKQSILRGKIEAWFYGLWLPTMIWTIAFAIYKIWTYMFLYDVSLVDPLDYYSGIFFSVFYLIFYWGYSVFNKNLRKSDLYDATHVFKIIFSILLFFICALLCSFCFLLVQLRF